MNRFTTGLVQQYLNNLDVPPPSATPAGPAGGDLTGSYPNPDLVDIVVAGSVGTDTEVGQVTFDSKGRIVSASNVPIAFPPSTPTGSAGGDLTGTYPNPTLAAITTAGTAGNSTNVAQITRDAKGRVTGLLSVPIVFPLSVTRFTCTVSRNTATSFAINDIINYPVIISDSQAMYNNGTGGTGGTAGVVCPAFGSYLICCNCLFGTSLEVIAVQVNGVDILRLSGNGATASYNGSIVYPAATGNLIRVRCVSALTTSATQAAWSLSVTRLV